MRELDFRHDLLPLKDQLFRLALRITRQQAEAEDIVQDTLMKLWERREKLKEVKSVEAYALTVCRNISLDRINLKQTQNLSLDSIETEKPADDFSPQEKLEREETYGKLRQLIEKLPEQQRTILQLRDIEGLSTQKTAEAMQMTENAVKVNLFRARQMIKKLYFETDEHGL